MSHLICHLIDSNVDTSYFRSIARCHDHVRFPVMIGSIAPEGTLQRAMRGLGTPTFSLNAAARWLYPAAVARLASLMRRNKVSVLHAHCFDPTFVGMLAARLARVRFVFTRHHSDHNIRLGKKWHTKIDAWCARNADHVIAVSDATRRVMIDVEGVPRQQVTVIYNGMEPLRKPDPERTESLRSELGLTGKQVCLMVARLHEEKGHRYLFEAIPEVVSRTGPVIVLLAGDGPHQASLKSEVRERGLQDAVRFLGRSKEIPELLMLASVVVLPSLAESFGFALLEAMSMGKPVVATAIGGIPELIADGESGLLVAPRDARALAEAVCAVLTDPVKAQALGTGARRKATSFTFERMMSGYEKVYSKVMGLTAIAASQPISSGTGTAKRERATG